MPAVDPRLERLVDEAVHLRSLLADRSDRALQDVAFALAHSGDRRTWRRPLSPRR
jgi:hypothetical protein